MSDDTVNIQVNGVPLKARKGQMIMQVTDPAQIYIPRFCYHDKLSVAANCRMCLVEVEKAPKPMPACATPVTEGMKVFTKSPKAEASSNALANVYAARNVTSLALRSTVICPAL